MMRFVEYDCVPLQGELVYRAYEHSFDFKVKSSSDLTERIGNKGTTSLLIGTLQIEVGIEVGAALFVWGLHSHFSQWRRDHLSAVPAKRGGIRVLFDEEPTIGISQGLADVGEWHTAFDPNTGWICISSNQSDSAERYIEFAENTIAGVSNEKLVSVRLHPTWYQERFLEEPASLFSKLEA